MAFDFTQPIDIQKVKEMKIKYTDMLVSLLMESADKTLKHCTPMPGITSAIKLGGVRPGSILSKYTGKFKGDKKLGEIVPRLLEVWPIVAEMMDEPERYRKTYIAEVPGALRKDHPFELWLLQYGIKLASQDLYRALFVAERSESEEDTTPEKSFNGWGTILDAEKTATNISLANGNMFATGAMTKENIGEKLLEMYRHMPATFREQKDGIKMHMSADMADMYDDWRKKQGVVVIGGTEEVETVYLLGSNKKCEIVREGNFPEGSQFVILTTKANMVYGFDKESDMTNMMPFASGNPYMFTAAMKFVFGCEFISIDKSELCINDQAWKPASSGAQTPTQPGEGS